MFGTRKFCLACVSTLAMTTGLFSAASAQAACSSTLPAAGAFSSGSFAPLAAGGAINSLTSAINAANTIFLDQSTDFLETLSAPQQPGQPVGSVWARGMGGGQTTKGSTQSTYSLGGAFAGSTSCQTSTQLNFGGVQVGTDLSSTNYAGFDLHAGSSLGYLGATGKDATSAGPANPFGGSLNNNLQIPFVGVYGVATKGNFFVSGAARWLYIQNSFTDPQDGMFNQHVDARGVAINGTVGYNVALPNNWFFEPSGGLIWSQTTVDPFNTAGTFVLGSGAALPGQVSVSEIHNLLGRVGARVGTTIETGSVILQPYGTASFFREFEGNPSATVTTIGAPGVPAASAIFNTSGIGNYGEFGLGLSGQIKNTGWLGFVRADYRTGDNIQGWGVNGGVRYQFAAEQMTGMPLLTNLTKIFEPDAKPTAYNWTGLRVGAMLGADWGYSSWNIAGNGTPTRPRFAGILPGGLIGYDYQIGKWVVGVGGDMGWTNARGSEPCPFSSFVSCENKADWLATVGPRIGYAFWGDRVLTYGKAGVAIGDFKVRYSCNTGAVAVPGVAGCPGASDSKTSMGWVIGGGTELALSQNWSVRAETNYYDLGTDHYQPVLGGTPMGVDVHHTGYSATIGVAYRFDLAPPTPMVAKY